jgi:hypothetical protein
LAGRAAAEPRNEAGAGSLHHGEEQNKDKNEL